MSRVGRVLGIIAAALVLGFLAIQLVPVERTNPPVIAEPNWDTPETRVLAQRACFDCHSNETVWPWYSYVAPVSWLVARDTNEGREVLNFSEWGSGGEGREPWEMLEAVESGYMPPQIYLPTRSTGCRRHSPTAPWAPASDRQQGVKRVSMRKVSATAIAISLI